MTNNSKQISTTGPDEGQVLQIAGGQYRIVISGEETNGDYALIEMTVPPGAGPNPHAHAAIRETFFVIEGEFTYYTESGKYIAKKNSFINIPTGGAIHSFKNLTDKPAKVLCTVIPAGLEGFFLEMADVMATPPASEAELKEKIREVAEKYGQELYPVNYFDNIK